MLAHPERQGLPRFTSIPRKYNKAMEFNSAQVFHILRECPLVSELLI
jgi:hypothetical protein